MIQSIELRRHAINCTGKGYFSNAIVFNNYPISIERFFDDQLPAPSKLISFAIIGLERLKTGLLRESKFFKSQYLIFQSQFIQFSIVHKFIVACHWANVKLTSSYKWLITLFTTFIIAPIFIPINLTKMLQQINFLPDFIFPSF